MFAWLGKVFLWLARGIVAVFRAGLALVQKSAVLGLLAYGGLAYGAYRLRKAKGWWRALGWILFPFAVAFGAGVTTGLGVFAARAVAGGKWGSLIGAGVIQGALWPYIGFPAAGRLGRWLLGP